MASRMHWRSSTISRYRTSSLAPWYMTQYIVPVRALYGLKSSHPINVPVREQAEIREIFDDTSYSKGASILRMLEQFLREATFRRGIRDYLKAHAHGNARTEDLWRALTAASHQPVRALMGSWTRQTGFPLLDVQVKRTGGSARVGLTQSRLLYRDLLAPSQDRPRAKVPVRVAPAGQEKPVSFLMEQETE